MKEWPEFTAAHRTGDKQMFSGSQGLTFGNPSSLCKSPISITQDKRLFNITDSSAMD